MLDADKFDFARFLFFSSSLKQRIAKRGMSALVYFPLFRGFRAWTNKDYAYVHVEVLFSKLHLGTCSPAACRRKFEALDSEKKIMRSRIAWARVTCTRANQFLKILVYLLFFFFSSPLSRKGCCLFLPLDRLLGARVNSQLSQLFEASLNFKLHFDFSSNCVRVPLCPCLK